MFKFRHRTYLLPGLACLLLPQSPVSSAGQTVKKVPLSYAAYDSWKAIANPTISRNGKWVVYSVVPGEGDGELIAKNTQSGVEYHHPRGTAPVISADCGTVVFTIRPLKAELDKAKKDKKKPEELPKNSAGIMSLKDGKVTVVEHVTKFLLPETGGTLAALQLEAAAKPKVDPKVEPKEAEIKPAIGAAPTAPKKPAKNPTPGTDLIVLDLGTGAKTTIVGVSEFAWNRDGTRLVYAISLADKFEQDGVYVRTAAGETTNLVTGKADYKSLCFNRKGDATAFLTNRDDYTSEAPHFSLYYWNVGSKEATAVVNDKSQKMPMAMAVSDNAAPRFSKDGSLLILGLAAPPKAAPKDAPDVISVDIWNYKDGQLQPNQKIQAETERKRTFDAVWHVKSRKFVPLATEAIPTIEFTDESNTALATSDTAYRQLQSWDGEYSDVYLIKLDTGEMEPILTKSRYGAVLSPGGNFVIYFSAEEHNWMAYRTRDKKRFNLTASIKTSLVNELNDVPDAPQPYGGAGWTAGDKSVLIYDRYDIWECFVDQKEPRCITNGDGKRYRTTYRYPKLDVEQITVPTDKPLLLTTIVERTKATGFAQCTIGGHGSDDGVVSKTTQLIKQDKSLTGLVKAKDADQYLFTQQTFEEYPDLWTSSAKFDDARKISNVNPQQSQYTWGHEQLIDYKTGDGKQLNAVLIKPENFDPSKRYPLMVYIYERLSDQLHAYHRPAPGTNINIARYVSNGYVVLMPDIAYDTGYPGESAMKCVIPAVQKVESYGYIDPERVGIQGHSWGGYEITYMITRTDIFRAVEAGASVSNMISAYGGIRWGTGVSRAGQYEHGQSRIGAPPWEKPLQYIENSPIFWVDKVHTPYLTMANDADGAVPWYQGIEFFSAMRRLGKEAYMFNYNGENHGLLQRENMKHWTIHLDEFFDHYLLGKPLPDWMDKGVPYLEHGKRDVKAYYSPVEAKTN